MFKLIFHNQNTAHNYNKCGSIIKKLKNTLEKSKNKFVYGEFKADEHVYGEM